jgi:hypothetical protein
MKRPIHILRRSLFGLGIAAALGFGAAEAFAIPMPARDEARPWCDPVKCNASCGGQGICRGFECLCV